MVSDVYGDSWASQAWGFPSRWLSQALSPCSWASPSLSLSLCAHMASHPPALSTWLGLPTAQASPYTVAGFQEAGSGSAQPVKSYPWGWHNVTCAVSCWSKPSQNLLTLKGWRKRPPSPDGRVARSHWQGTCGREISAVIFGKQTRSPW